MNKVYTYIIITVFIYLIFTTSEYIIHKFVMHNETTSFGKEHVLHHKLTNDETCDITETSQMDNRQNLCFDDQVSYFCFTMFVLFILVLRKFTKNIEYALYSFLLFVMMTFFMIIIWNSMHPYIHNEHPSKRCKIYLSKSYIDKIKNTSYVQWIISNHKLHHMRKGDRKGNYNVVYPGADYLFGTAYTSI